MGCCGSSSTFCIPPEAIKPAVADLRTNYGSDLLIMSIKDQNVPGKLCLSGNADADLVKAISTCLLSDESNKTVVLGSDQYDHMWDYTWRNTRLTSGTRQTNGLSTMFFQKSYFPRGQIIVKLLDTFANFGWGLTACPNMGGVERRGEEGDVTSTVDWPVFVFYKEPQSEFTSTHLLLAVKDQNMPGKLCAAGPVGAMEDAMTKTLGQFADNVKCGKDSYDADFDVVWRNTSITNLSKSYFPKGKTNISLLQCAYSFGWRAVAAPNLGCQGDSWPCYILRKLKDASAAAPELCIGAIKDSDIPGKFCFSGPSANGVVDALCGALRTLPNNADVKNEKDSYDTDHDAVARNVNITSGTFSSWCGVKYFPRGDSMKTVLDTWTQQGWQVACCPNFGGMLGSWPTFVLEKRHSPVGEQMFLAVKDDKVPGKVDMVGGASVDQTLGQELLLVFQTLCGPDVTIAQDDYDTTYSLAFRNTRLTTGHDPLTYQKPYWPHGYVLEMMLQVLLKRGWKAQGGPNFGDTGNTWPGIILTRET